MIRKQATYYLVILMHGLSQQSPVHTLTEFVWLNVLGRNEKLNWKDRIANGKSNISNSTAMLYKCSQEVVSLRDNVPPTKSW